jgi:hypothetical protein
VRYELFFPKDQNAPKLKKSIMVRAFGAAISCGVGPIFLFHFFSG